LTKWDEAQKVYSYSLNSWYRFPNDIHPTFNTDYFQKKMYCTFSYYLTSKNRCGNYSNFTNTHCSQNDIYTLFLQSIVGLVTYDDYLRYNASMPSFWSSIFKMLKITQHSIHNIRYTYYALLILLIFCSILFRFYSVISPKIYSNMCSALGLYPKLLWKCFRIL